MDLPRIDQRKGIAHGLDCGLAFAEMDGMFHRAESTTANEVKNRMIWSNKGYGCTNDVCERFETCSKVFRTSCGKKLPFKNQRKCFEMCEDYVRKTCPKLGRAPFVCNGCAEQNTCPSASASTGPTPRRKTTGASSATPAAGRRPTRRRSPT